MTLTFTQTIHAPIERVFDCVDDNEKLKIWAEGVEEIIPGDPWNPDDPVGSRYTMHIREGGRIGEYQGEILAYEKPAHMAVSMGNAMFTMRVDYRFVEMDESTTHMTYTLDTEYHSTVARIMGGLFGWMTRRILNKQMAAFKALAESGN